MKPKNPVLPNDVPALRALLIKQQERIAQQQATIASLHDDLNALNEEIDRLSSQLDKLRRLYFARMPEQPDRQPERQIVQFEHRLQERLMMDRGRQALVVNPAPSPVLLHCFARPPLPPDLPREERCLEPLEPVCPACGGELKLLGGEVSEQLELNRSTFKVIQTRRNNKACARCDVIVRAPGPSHPIERGIAGPGLLSRVITAKYAEHMPLNCLSDSFARQGVALSRGTMAGWAGLCGHLLAPLADAVSDYVMSTNKMHIADAPAEVAQPGNAKPTTGRLWVYVRDDRNAGSTLPPAVWFAYSPDRKSVHPQMHLAGLGGPSPSEDYAGINLPHEESPVREVGSMAYARRKILDIHRRHPSPITTEALDLIGKLYAIEEAIRGRAAEERREVREKRSQPILIILGRRVRETLTRLSRQADEAKAFNYLINHWPALYYYSTNGWAEIDNTIAENVLKVVCQGRKYALFTGSDSGGERAALMFTLIGSCHLNGVAPQAYLRHVLATVADHPADKIKELLPWNVDIPAD
ncbi:IS66 family transposase [Acerihabitans sp.]|uniref:IS66 family transposase n=1 Tax=Acerihabitans sp. TaxID=2811394 RepID=UPI002EDAC90B